MKKLFLILSVALFALGTVNAFAQEAAAAAETQLAGDSLHHVMIHIPIFLFFISLLFLRGLLKVIIANRFRLVFHTFL